MSVIDKRVAQLGVKDYLKRNLSALLSWTEFNNEISILDLQTQQVNDDKRRLYRRCRNGLLKAIENGDADCGALVNVTRRVARLW